MALIASPVLKSKPLPFSPLHKTTSENKSRTCIVFNLCVRKTKSDNIYTKHADLRRGFLTGLNRSCNRSVFVVNGVSEGATGADPEGKNFGRILLSDVVVKRRTRVFRGRKWNSLDIGTAGVVLAMHLLSFFAPFYFNWAAFWVASWLYVVTGLLGITLSFHRNLSHRSFKLPKWLEYLFAYCGVQALQVWLCIWRTIFCVWLLVGVVCHIMCCFDGCRGTQLIGSAHTGTTISIVIQKGTLIAPLKGSGSVTWVGFLIQILLMKGYDFIYMSFTHTERIR